MLFVQARRRVNSDRTGAAGHAHARPPSSYPTTAQTAQPVDIGSLSLDALIQMVLLNNKRCSFACLGLPLCSPPVANQHGKGALACSRDGPALDPASLLVAALWVRGRALAVRMPGRVEVATGALPVPSCEGSPIQVSHAPWTIVGGAQALPGAGAAAPP